MVKWSIYHFLGINCKNQTTYLDSTSQFPMFSSLRMGLTSLRTKETQLSNNEIKYAIHLNGLYNEELF